MKEQQLDLFSEHAAPGTRAARDGPPPAPDMTAIDDSRLIAAITDARLADAVRFCKEVARRKLARAVPALSSLCRRFAGFGSDRIVPEQSAALAALAAIGGHEAAQAVADLIERGTVQGPGLPAAVSTAAQLHASLTGDTLRTLLRHPDAAIRAGACRCARPSTELAPTLIDLLHDVDDAVARSAACALGRMARAEALPILKDLLARQPSEEVIDAVVPIADETCAVLLGRIARSTPSLARPALEALDSIDDPKAATIGAAVRRSLSAG